MAKRKPAKLTAAELDADIAAHLFDRVADDPAGGPATDPPTIEHDDGTWRKGWRTRDRAQSG